MPDAEEEGANTQVYSCHIGGWLCAAKLILPEGEQHEELVFHLMFILPP